jgi:hypothetical protein
MLEGFSVALLLSIGALGLSILMSRSVIKRRSDFIRNRPKLDTHEIWKRFYSSQQVTEDIFRDNWQFISKVAKIDPSLLRPTDRIADFAQRNPRWCPGDEWDTVFMLLRSRARKCAYAPDWESIQTVDEIMQVAIECSRREGG